MQDMANTLKCSSRATHILAVGLAVSFSNELASKQSAYTVASELQASFRSSLMGLNLHGMCHGTLRVPSLGRTPSRPSVPTVLPPDSACTHGTSERSSTCLPLWRVHVFKGACTTRAMNSSVLVPSGAPDHNADIAFTTTAVDFFKSTCREAFPGFPASWKHDYCARFSSEICTTGEPQVVRLVLEAGGPSLVPASLVVDGEVVAFVENAANVVETGNVAAWATSHTKDAVVVLRRGCHRIQVFFEEPAERAKLALGAMTMVSRSPWCCQHW
jgi:hypothetical protein